MRFFDLLLASIGLIILLPVISLLVGVNLVLTGSPIFFQKRLGRNKKVFTIIKLRTMHLNTENAATHLVSENSITPFGQFLRSTKLDELPQLFNVLIGHMSFVGPRPGLVDHSELIVERERFDVFSVRPGITGLAQVRGVDMSKPRVLAEVDSEMIRNMSLVSYFSLIFSTIMRKKNCDLDD